MGLAKINIPYKWLWCILLYSLHMQAGFANKKAPADSSLRSNVLSGISYEGSITEDDDGKEVFRATSKKKKQRFYLNASSRQFNLSQRILSPDSKQDYYIQEKENKSGIYQWHDAFLPAYYNFLFRYTLF